MGCSLLLLKCHDNSQMHASQRYRSMRGTSQNYHADFRLHLSQLPISVIEMDNIKDYEHQQFSIQEIVEKVTQNLPEREPKLCVDEADPARSKQS